MLNHYTANRKVRNDDAYSPGGEIGRRPDRATSAYCQRAREAYKGVPIIAGGVEASLRRLAHYDYWSDKVRRSILLDAKPDLLVFGMGERPLVEIVRRLAAGEAVRQLRDIRGVAYRLGAAEVNDECGTMNDECKGGQSGLGGDPSIHHSSFIIHHSVTLPSFEEVSRDKAAFAAMTRMIHEETNPYNARPLVQRHGREAVVVNPPAWPLSQEEIDRIYGLPFTRRPHPSYGRRRIPAFEVVKDSIQIMRGCFGGCTFCSITVHEGRIIQSRSEASILAEIERMGREPDFSGTVSDLGGPTANMYAMNCSQPKAREKCRRQSCLHPAICPRLATDHGPLLHLLDAARRQPGVKQALVASGIRMDLAVHCPEYIRQVARHHTGGLLKVAPEHVAAEVLRRMHKPAIDSFEAFARQFQEEAAAAGKTEFLVPYFIAGHPGLRSAGDDRVGVVPEAKRPEARQGAGLHSRPDGRRHVHVLHGPRSDDGRIGLRAARRPRAAAATGAAAILQTGELRQRPRGVGSGRPPRPDRRRSGMSDPIAAAEDRGEREEIDPPRTTDAHGRLSAASKDGEAEEVMDFKQIDKRERLARECAKLDPEEEKAFAEEGMINTAAPPPYDCDDYELLDFGDGRRLERFGEIVLDRPCPAAETFERAFPDSWMRADARFEGRDEVRGEWMDRRELSERWVVTHGRLRFELKRTEFGHLGLFPEQAENWDWIAGRCPLSVWRGRVRATRRLTAGNAIGNQRPSPPAPLPKGEGRQPKVLNLFAYTGGSTLAAAAAGTEVVHVDAAKNVVAWARRNAELSGLANAPIRWIAEDALNFAKRELKRGRRYDAVILDPPSYGHGLRGEVWRLSKHLPRLLALCAELTDGRPRFMLLTCHTPGYDAELLGQMVTEQFGGRQTIVAQPLMIEASDGRRLPSGVVVRCETASGLLPCQ